MWCVVYDCIYIYNSNGAPLINRHISRFFDCEMRERENYTKEYEQKKQAQRTKQQQHTIHTQLIC